MSTLNALIDKARVVCKREEGRDSDSAVADRLHVARNTVSVWRKGGDITDKHLAALVKLAQVDPALAVRVREESAKTTDERALWGPLWDRLSPVTTKVAGVLLLLAVLPHPASASPVAFPLADLNNGQAMHYAKKVRGWLTALMGRWRAAWRSHAASPVLA